MFIWGLCVILASLSKARLSATLAHFWVRIGGKYTLTWKSLISSTICHGCPQKRTITGCPSKFWIEYSKQPNLTWATSTMISWVGLDIILARLFAGLYIWLISRECYAWLRPKRTKNTACHQLTRSYRYILLCSYAVGEMQCCMEMSQGSIISE